MPLGHSQRKLQIAQMFFLRNAVKMCVWPQFTALLPAAATLVQDQAASCKIQNKIRGVT